MVPEQSEHYIREFVRVLRPGGITVFQVPSQRTSPESLTTGPVAMTDDAYRVGLAVEQSVSQLTAGERFPVTVTGGSVDSHGARAAADTPHRWSGSDAPRDVYAAIPNDVQEPGEFPMFGLHQDLVLRVMKESGATVFFQEPDDRGGPEWVGFRYFVRKSE